MEIRKLMEEMKDVLFILLVTAFFTWIANCIQLPKVNMAESSIGVLLLVVITAFGILVSHLPGFRILPMVFWVSIIAVVISLPGFPGVPAHHDAGACLLRPVARQGYRRL